MKHEFDTCPHPYDDVVHENDEAYYDDPGVEYFVWCRRCNVVILFEGDYGVETPTKIPYFWPEKAREKLHELLPELPEEKPPKSRRHTPTVLGDTLNDIDSLFVDAALGNKTARTLFWKRKP